MLKAPEINAIANLLNSLTFSFTALHMLMLIYMAAPFVIAALFFKDNALLFYGTLAMVGIIWAVATYTVITNVFFFNTKVQVILNQLTLR